jgi:hypothetical protein
VKVPSSGDGVTQETEVGGRKCVQSAPGVSTTHYIYFDLDESFAFDLEPGAVTVEIEYFDAGCGGFAFEYDSLDPEGSVREGAFKHKGAVKIDGTQTWKKVTFRLDDARFADRSNGSDFRLSVQGPGELAVGGAKASKG